MVSVVTTQLCCCSIKAPIDNMQINEHSCVPINVIKKGSQLDSSDEPQFAKPYIRLKIMFAVIMLWKENKSHEYKTYS